MSKLASRDIVERAGAEFVRKYVARIEPELRRALRSRRLVLKEEPRRTIALRSDGVFVSVDAANQEDALVPLEVVRACPDVRALVGRIRATLLRASA